MKLHRVVVTGFSSVNPLANDFSSSWQALLDGKSGIAEIQAFDSSEYDAHIAGEVKNFNPEELLGAKQARRMDRFVQFATFSGIELVKHSGLKITEENAEDVSVLLGVGLGGLSTIETFHTKLLESGPSRISPFYIPMLISNMAPGQISIYTGARGSNLVMTSACASATHALGYAYTDVLLGRTRYAMTGGVEATVTPMGVSGFTALKALCSKYQDTPTKASRPFDRERAGFVLGEGSGLLMLESLESALERGATIYAEMVGFGTTSDAYHMTSPREDGSGMAAAMRNALKDANIEPNKIDHINAHGTATYANDLYETKAIKQVFGEHAYKTAICSTKSQTGHLLGAAGGIEAIFSCMALYTGIVPGTINLENPDPECDLNYMAGGPKKLDPEYVLSNSFGFGGTNASVIFKKYRD